MNTRATTHDCGFVRAGLVPPDQTGDVALLQPGLRQIAQTTLPDPFNLGAWCSLIDRRLSRSICPLGTSAADTLIDQMIARGGTLSRSGDRVTFAFGNVTVQLTGRAHLTTLRRWQQQARARLRRIAGQGA